MAHETVAPHNLPYRLGVGICLFNHQGKVLIAERRDRRGAWQMPQGGLNKGEIPHVAALRELKEEVGTDKAVIIARCPEVLRYEFPDWLQWRGGVFRGKYRGQEQVWFALLYTGTDEDIDLSGVHDHEPPEFVAWRWENLEKTPDLIVDFKRPVYDGMVKAFLPLVNTIQRGETLPEWQESVL